MMSRFVRACVVCATSILFIQANARAQTPASAPPPYSLGDAVRSAEQARREAPPPERPDVAVPQSAEPRFTMPEDQKLLVRHIKIDGPDLVGADEIRATLSHL